VSRKTQNNSPSVQAICVAAIEFGAAMTNRNSAPSIARSNQVASGPALVVGDLSFTISIS
jgi:hypothetical protein